jgi:ADP-heptose:LPS heptosyltransferase
MRLERMAEAETDFAETAALVANLDLVITVDTSVGHLGGSLGIATWILLPQHPDFRWMLERADSPWYPTVRLFRQRAEQAWAEPVAAMADLLQRLAGTGQPQGRSL